MLFHLLGQQVAPCNLQLLLIGIAGQLDDLHPVQQGPWNGGGGVGGSDEQHPAQIHGDLQEVVPEGVVLLAVQHLQHGGGGVPPVVAAHLVNLIQQQQRIHAAALGDGVDDPARHGPYVGLPVAADVRLVPYASQAQPGQLPVEGLGHGDGHGGLAHARRAHQADDLPLGLRVHLPHGDELQDPLLHLLQAEVVPVQDLSGCGHAGPLLGLLPPGHLQAHVQVVADHGGLGAGVGLLGQPVHLPEQLLLHLLGELPGHDLGPVVVQLGVLILPQLLLEQSDLLPDDVVPLDLPHFPADLALQLVLAGEDLRLPGQQLVDLPQTGHGPELLQHRLLVLVPEHDVLSDEVRQMARLPVIHDRGHDLPAQPGGQRGISGEIGVGLAQQSLQLGVGQAGLPLRHGLHVALEVGLRLPQPAQLCPAPALHHHPHGGIADAEDLTNHRNGAHAVQIPLPRLGLPQLPLGHQEDELLLLHGPLQGADRDVPLHVKADDAAREDGQSTQGQNRYIHGCIFDHIHSVGSP